MSLGSGQKSRRSWPGRSTWRAVDGDGTGGAPARVIYSVFLVSPSGARLTHQVTSPRGEVRRAAQPCTAGAVSPGELFRWVWVAAQRRTELHGDATPENIAALLRHALAPLGRACFGGGRTHGGWDGGGGNKPPASPSPASKRAGRTLAAVSTHTRPSAPKLVPVWAQPFAPAWSALWRGLPRAVFPCARGRTNNRSNQARVWAGGWRTRMHTHAAVWRFFPRDCRVKRHGCPGKTGAAGHGTGGGCRGGCRGGLLEGGRGMAVRHAILPRRHPTPRNHPTDVHLAWFASLAERGLQRRFCMRGQPPTDGCAGTAEVFPVVPKPAHVAAR